MGDAVLDKLFDAMRTGRGVPAQEQSVNAVLERLRQGAFAGAELAPQVVEDFALTQRVLKLANSPMYAPFSDGSASVSSALDVLGKEALMHIVLSTAVVDDEGLEQDPALSKTLLASELARSVCLNRTEDAAVAALLFDLGAFMCQRYLPDEHGRIEQLVAQGAGGDTAAQHVLGRSLRQLGTEIAQHWQLPSTLRAVLDGTGDPDLVQIARFSSTASTLIHSGRHEAAQALVQSLDVPGIDKSGIVSLLERKHAALQAAGRLTLVSTAVTTEIPAIPPIPDRTHAAELDLLFQSLLRDAPVSLDALANALLPAMASVLRTAHCLLLMPTRGGDFRVRHGVGKGLDAIRSQLRISAEFQPTAFHAVIKNNVDVSIDDVSRLKPASLPEGFRELLPNVTRFIILPIAHTRVAGLVYCDWDQIHTPDAAEVVALKRLRNLFLRFVPN